MVNEWLECFRPAAVVGLLEVTLKVVHAHTMTADEKEMLCRLVMNAPECTAHRLYRSISMLIGDAASADEISNAIGKVVRILDPEMFCDDRWWSVVVAFKQFDELTSSDIVN